LTTNRWDNNIEIGVEEVDRESVDWFKSVLESIEKTFMFFTA
jgi:hypothetical protein